VKVPNKQKWILPRQDIAYCNKRATVSSALRTTSALLDAARSIGSARIHASKIDGGATVSRGTTFKLERMGSAPLVPRPPMR
jgi:hypothetical protein